MYVILLLDRNSNREPLFKIGLEAGLTGVRLDQDDPFAHVGLGRMRTIRAEHDQAILSFDHAIALNPSFALAYYGKAHSLWQSGKPDEAVKNHDESIRLSPSDPLMWAFLASKAIALVMLERYDEALDCGIRARQYPMSAIWAFLGQLSALGHLGKTDEASETLAHALKMEPDLSIEFIERSLPITDKANRDHFQLGLRKAGVASN